MLAHALLRHGRIQEAIAVLADAFTKVSTTGVRLHLAQFRRGSRAIGRIARGSAGIVPARH
jgi:hypothetical protein